MNEWQVIQHWQGVVDEVDMETGLYYAELVDITAGHTRASERVYGLAISMLDECERKFVVVGGIFDWTISRRDAQLRDSVGEIIPGVDETKGEIVFRKERWSKADLEAGRIEAERLFDAIKFE